MAPPCLDDILSAMKSFETKLDGMNNNLSTKIEGVRNELTTHINELYNAVNGQVTAIKTELLLCTSKITEVQRQFTLNDMVISGIPYLSGENLMDTYHNICNAIGHVSSPNEINNIFRLPGTSTITPIIVKFCTYIGKRNFSEKYFKTKNLSLRAVRIESNNRIYINDYLIPAYRTLWKECLDLKKRGQFSKVGIRSGFIIVKQPGEVAATKITSAEDLTKLKLTQ